MRRSRIHLASALMTLAALLVSPAAYANGAFAVGGLDELVGWSFFLLAFSTGALVIGAFIDVGLVVSEIILLVKGVRSPKVKRFGWISMVASVGVVVAFSLVMVICCYVVALIAKCKDPMLVASIAFWVFSPLGIAILAGISLVAIVLAIFVVARSPEPQAA